MAMSQSGHDPKLASHTKPAMEWNVDEVIGWIEQKRGARLNEDVRNKLRMEEVTGEVFLICDGDQDFFRKCGLSSGTALVLAKLSKELAKEEKTSQQAEDVVSAAGNRERVESAEPANKRRHLEKADDIPSKLVSLAEKARSQRNSLLEQYPDPKNLFERLSNPTLTTTLPFPFPGKGKPVERFKITDECWLYVGREYFTTLHHEVKEFTSSATRKLSLYGTIGYGKSHLLAALVCYQTVDGKRVVYIPDCRELCEEPFEYFQAAMLFAWADDIGAQEHIIELKSMEAIHRFFRYRPEREILFIFDQINALDLDEGDDIVSNKKKEDVREWINAVAANHKVLYSASANNRARVRMDAKQTNQWKLYVYGGFSATEMEQWWIRNNDAIPDKYKGNDLDKDKLDDLKTFKSEVEDITGRIPLLLDDCIMEGKINLSAPKLNRVFRQVQGFMLTIHADHRAVWEEHCEYVTACIQNEAPPPLPLRYIDHRYFYVDDEKARYACGIAREAAARQLRKHKLTAFANQISLHSLVNYIHNPSVTGFFIEQAVLSSIVTHGLAVKKVHPHVRQEMFSSAYPRFDTSLAGWVLYCPLRFNYPAVDAILVQFVKVSKEDNSRKNISDGKDNSGEKKKCLMYPIQVTVAKSHADAEEQFFNHEKDWTRGLGDYDIEVEFCWITPDQEFRIKDVPASSRSLRSGDIPRSGHKMTHIPLREVSQEIWSQYQLAKRSQG